MTRRDRIALWLTHYRKGRGYGYPRCCCTRFALEIDRGGAALRRGVKFTGRSDERGNAQFFVPCGVFHRRQLSVTELDLLERDAQRLMVDVISSNFPDFAELLIAMAKYSRIDL